MALGEDVLPPVLRRHEADLGVEYVFEEPAQRVEQLALVADHVAHELDQALLAASVRCGRVRIVARTERGDTLERVWRTDVGTRAVAGETGTVLYLRTQALSRLLIDNVPNIQTSWVTQGPGIGQVGLRYGANDMGSTMFEENVVSSAGTTFGMDAAQIERHARALGFRVARRNMRYELLCEPA